MSGPATYAIPPTFLGIAARDTSALVCVAGIPLDIGTTNRSGARFAPAAIRQASRMLVDGDHPQHWVDPTAMGLADIGDFAIALGDIAASMALIEEQAGQFQHLVALGGDHSITLPLLRALANRRGAPALVHFDAHVDTWPDNFGQAYAHGSVFIMTAPEVHEAGPAAVAARIRDVVGQAPVYLSFDIDVLDPAFAPGTGTPEIGGLASWQAQAILRRLQGLKFVGMDLVEVAPAYDVAEITALAGATMVWEYLCLLAQQQRQTADDGPGR